MSEQSTLTDAMALFAVSAHHFPALARQRARDALIDCTGCMLAGSREPLAGILGSMFATQETASATCPSPLIGAEKFAAPADAALYNGTLGHALDYDDTNHPAYAHPTTVLAAAMFAILPHVSVSGRQLIDAYIVGFEFFGKLGRALNTQHYKRGWHTTGTFGALAAAAAAGRLLGLDAGQMRIALAIAASGASGLRANFGTMVKPLHAGQAARNGVFAALLAQAGFTANDDIMGHRYGYVEVFNANIDRQTEPLGQLGIDLEILTEHGLALKPYAACGATHPGIEAAERLFLELKERRIRSVHVGVSEMAFSPLIYVMPDTPLQGKFSLHFCIAAALTYGKVSLSTFHEEVVGDTRVRDLISRITMELDERWKDDGEFATEVAVTLEDGTVLRQFIPLAQGKPARWFSEERLRAKFDDCTEALGARQACLALRECLFQLDTAPDCNALTLCLTALSATHHAMEKA